MFLFCFIVYFSRLILSEVRFFVVALSFRVVGENPKNRGENPKNRGGNIIISYDNTREKPVFF